MTTKKSEPSLELLSNTVHIDGDQSPRAIAERLLAHSDKAVGLLVVWVDADRRLLYDASPMTGSLQSLCVMEVVRRMVNRLNGEPMAVCRPEEDEDPEDAS